MTTEPRQEAERLVREHHQAWVLYQDARTASNLQALEDSTARLVAVLAAATDAEDKRQELFAERARRRDAVEESKAEEAHDEALDRLFEALSELR